MSTNLKLLFALLLGVVVGASVSHVYDNAKFNDAIKLITINEKIKNLVYGFDNLHLLIIKNYSTLKQQFEDQIPDDAKSLKQLYPLHNTESITDLDKMLRASSMLQKSLMDGAFRGLYVLNEKFPIKKWKDDPKFMKILEQAAKSDPKEIKALQSRDWSKQLGNR